MHKPAYANAQGHAHTCRPRDRTNSSLASTAAALPSDVGEHCARAWRYAFPRALPHLPVSAYLQHRERLHDHLRAQNVVQATRCAGRGGGSCAPSPPPLRPAPGDARNHIQICIRQRTNEYTRTCIRAPELLLELRVGVIHAVRMVLLADLRKVLRGRAVLLRVAGRRARTRHAAVVPSERTPRAHPRAAYLHVVLAAHAEEPGCKRHVCIPASRRRTGHTVTPPPPRGATRAPPNQTKLPPNQTKPNQTNCIDKLRDMHACPPWGLQ